MKTISMMLALVLLTGCFPEEKKYCGKVVEKFRTDAGYKSSPQAHVVFYNDSLKRNIDVKVTWNCYANTEVGEHICFDLFDRDLED